MFNELISKKEKVSVVGLGYVGLPLAVAFAKKFEVVGYDRNTYKIEKYHEGIDVTEEVGNEAVQNTSAVLSNDPEDIKSCRFHVIAVPTPINEDKTPNLTPVVSASETVGKYLEKGSIVVYESTVYPGVTEDICIPILEKESGLKHGVDFKVGYSPERINPGDKVHRLETIVKVVSGCDEESLETIAKVYEEIIEAGVHRASCIKVAEAAKVIENSQRDINIAFMNELSIIFNEMNIDTKEVLEAASTKWNFLNFYPGLVGGHCIGVDPYYLTYKAEQMGYHSQIILSGRKINDDMGKFVAQNTVKQLIKADKQIKGSRVGIMGVTFKENCPDVRNTKVVDVISELEEYGIETIVYDPVADLRDLENEYGIKTVSKEAFIDLDSVVIAVSHTEFMENGSEYFGKIINGENKVVMDIKGILNKKEMEREGFTYWRL
jgi:UDP-N-acetyl-D-galactosamine dehydrogenase